MLFKFGLQVALGILVMCGKSRSVHCKLSICKSIEWHRLVSLISLGAQKGHHTLQGHVGSMVEHLWIDLGGSFHESMDSPILPSLPSMSRSSFRVTQGDVWNYYECLHFDPEYVRSDNKFQRLGELKRIANVALGTLQDGSASGSLKGRLLSSLSHEDLKKTKAALQEGSDDARERGKIFSEAFSMFKKFFASIPLRKRS